MATVNLLLDCSITATFSANDQGGGETYSGSVSFKADRVRVNQTTRAEDHSTAQDRVEMQRIKKNGMTVEVETKFYNSSLVAALQTNDLIQVVVTAPTGFGVTVKGVIGDIDTSYDIPSTLRFTILCHGTDAVYA